jgi:hypothetical protein
MFVNVDYHLTDIIIPNTLDYITQGQTGDATEDIFGDAITEDMGKILASVYDSDPEPLLRLIENPEANEYARGQALIAVVALVFRGHITREFAMDYMKQLLMASFQIRIII